MVAPSQLSKADRLVVPFWSMFSQGPNSSTFHFQVPKGQVSLWLFLDDGPIRWSGENFQRFSVGSE